MKKKLIQYCIVLLGILLLTGCGNSLSKENKILKKKNEELMFPKCIALLDERLGGNQYKVKSFKQLITGDGYGTELKNQYELCYSLDRKKYHYRFVVNEDYEIEEILTNKYTKDIKDNIVMLVKQSNGINRFEEMEINFNYKDENTEFLPEDIRTLDDYVEATTIVDQEVPLGNFDITLLMENDKNFDISKLDVLPLFEKLKLPRLTVLNMKTDKNRRWNPFHKKNISELVKERANFVTDKVTFSKEKEDSSEYEKYIQAYYEHFAEKAVEDFTFVYNDHFYDAKIYFNGSKFDIEMYKIDFDQPGYSMELENNTFLQIDENNNSAMVLYWEEEHKGEKLIDESREEEYPLDSKKELIIFDPESNEDLLQKTLKLR